jgi:hypothetical protein
MVMRRVRSFDPADRGRVGALAEADPHAPLRYLSLFGSPVAGAARRLEVEGHVDAERTLIAEEDRTIVGALGVRDVPYLTEHFGVPFRTIGPLVIDPARHGADRGAIVEELLDAVVADDDGGVARVDVLRIEGDDVAGHHAALAAGFLPMETSLTWVNDLERAHLNPPRTEWPSIRLHRPGIDPPLSEDQLAGVRGGGALVKDDHYHNDDRLDPERADALYERWLERGLAGEVSDVAVLHHVEGQLVGLGLWRRWRELEPLGVSALGNGFGFRSAWAPAGTTHGFSSIVCNRPLLDNRLLEWTTQSTNYAMANMIAREPSIRLCRSSHVFHRWSRAR